MRETQAQTKLKPLEVLLAEWCIAPDGALVDYARTGDEMARRLRAVANAVEGWPADWMEKEQALGSPTAAMVVKVHRALAGEIEPEVRS